MANTTYVGSATSQATAVTKEYPVANGVTVSDGDMVYLSSGRVTNATITSAVDILGMVQGGQSNDPSNVGTTFQATGDSAGTVKVLVTVEPNAKYVMKNDNIGTTFAATHIGQFFALIGSTGAQLVDTSTVSATSGTVECIAFGFNGDNTLGQFIISNHLYKDSA